MSAAGATRTGGRPAIDGVIRGRYSLSVGNPATPAPDGWTWTMLTELARLESGHTPSRKHAEYWDGDIPWIGIRDATANHGRTLTDTAQHVTELGIQESSARVLPANTVCLSRTASVGYVVVMGQDMATSQDFVNWVCSNDLDHRFLKYVLLAEHDTYLSFASGTTHQTIYFPEVKAFHICRPTIDVQRRVADVLQSIDDLIENNLRRIALLEEMAQAIHREWFVNFRYPGHEHVALVDSPLGPIPEGWDVGELGDYLVLQRGFDLPSSQRREGPVPIIGASGIQGSHSDARVQGPGVCTGRSGTIGEVVYVPTAFWPLNTALWVKEFIRATPLFAYFLLKSIDLKELAGGAAVPSLNRNHIHGLPLVLAPKEIITRWDEVVDPMFRQAESVRTSAGALSSIRDFLLPKLVTGEIDVSHLDLDALIEGASP